MYKFLVVLIILALLVVAYFFYQGYVSKQGSALGLASGKLAACSSKPNCVCSEEGHDAEHSIDALAVKGDAAEQWMRLVSAIESLGGVVTGNADGYLSATFTSSIFGFVDDVEARLDEAASVIHIRSASRVGHSDLGANRKRVEAIRAEFGK